MSRAGLSAVSVAAVTLAVFAASGSSAPTQSTFSGLSQSRIAFIRSPQGYDDGMGDIYAVSYTHLTLPTKRIV